MPAFLLLISLAGRRAGIDEEQREQVPQVDAGADRHRGERGPADGVALGPAQGARDEVAGQVSEQADHEGERASLQSPQPAGVQRKVHSPGTTLRAAASREPSDTRPQAAATPPYPARDASR